jgi:hypothetical protein
MEGRSMTALVDVEDGADELVIPEECLDAIVEEIRQHPAKAGGLGKWRQRGIPHKGWECVHVYELDRGDQQTCEMCETAKIHFVHVMRHANYEGELEVGSVCAGHMQEDLAAARERESEFKRRKRPRVAVALKWLAAADEILAINKLSESERELVNYVRNRAEYCASPKVRKRLSLTREDAERFRDLHARIMGDA